MNPRSGARIWIPCEVKPGAFSDERMVRVSHEGGVWLGVVDVSSLRELGREGVTHILGIVEDILEDRFTARLPGDAVTSAPFLGSLKRVTWVELRKA